MAGKFFQLRFRDIARALVLILVMIAGFVFAGKVLVGNACAAENQVNIRLDGATEYELAEIFGKVVQNAPGVIESRRYSSKIIPDSPNASFVHWRVRIEGTDPGRLQGNIMGTIRQIISAGGNATIRGVLYRLSADEVGLLKKIRPANASGTEIQFVAGR
jgi:hypothetical protein